MERTKNRPLVKGVISGSNAIVFAIILGMIGNLVLYFFTNPLTVIVASVGFFTYVVLYSIWKSKTIYGTAIGSIAGAVPPVVGYCAVSNHFDLGALILFTLLVLWQMPHFFSIAFYRLADYTAAGMPLLPIKKGAFRTKIHMAIYIIGFVIASGMLTYFHYTGTLFLITSVISGCAWFALSIKGFQSQNDELWGRQMFRLSLVIITLFSVVVSFDFV